MPSFTITYRQGHGVETVDADELRVEGAFVVLASYRLVIFEPRRIVVRRVPVADVETVESEPR